MTMMSGLSLIIAIIITIIIPVILTRRPGSVWPSRLSMRWRGIAIAPVAIAITVAIVRRRSIVITVTVESVSAVATGDDVHPAVVGGTVTIAGRMVVAVVVVGHFSFVVRVVVCKKLMVWWRKRMKRG